MEDRNAVVRELIREGMESITNKDINRAHLTGKAYALDTDGFTFRVIGGRNRKGRREFKILSTGKWYWFDKYILREV